MTEHNWQLLTEELQLVSVLIGTCCVWKNGPGLFTELRLKNQRLHNCSFCMKIKQKYGESVCVRHDTETLAAYLRSEKPVPGLFRCPAGAEE